MGRVLTNSTTLAVAIEDTIGVLPLSPEWRVLEPNTIGTYGATITTVARNPISRNRQRRKGTVTDLDSSVEWEADLTRSHFDDFAEGFVFANFLGEVDRTPSAVSATEYTVDAGTTIPVQSLVRGVGFGVPGNNDLHVVDGAPTATTISATGLAIEAVAPTGARVEYVGLQGATGDLGVTNVGGVITLTSTVLDFTDFTFFPGQFIHIGGTATSNRFFASPSTDNSGYVRVVSVAANALVVDKAIETFITDAGVGIDLQIFLGRFLKNVPTNDANFLERSFHYEAELPGLAPNGTDSMYEYARGNFCDSMAISMPQGDKSTISFGFVGTDTDIPTLTRATNAATPIEPVRTSAYNTSVDCTRLRITQIDETGLTTDFKSLTVTLSNNISPEKVLCTLGARFMNFGNFEVNVEAQLLYTNSQVVEAIRNNTTLTLDFGVKNDDGVIMFDIPSLTLGDGSREYPVDESVLINTTSEAFQDPTLNSSIGITILQFVPTL